MKQIRHSQDCKARLFTGFSLSPASGGRPRGRLTIVKWTITALVVSLVSVVLPVAPASAAANTYYFHTPVHASEYVGGVNTPYLDLDLSYTGGQAANGDCVEIMGITWASHHGNLSGGSDATLKTATIAAVNQIKYRTTDRLPTITTPTMTVSSGSAMKYTCLDRADTYYDGSGRNLSLSPGKAFAGLAAWTAVSLGVTLTVMYLGYQFIPAIAATTKFEIMAGCFGGAAGNLAYNLITGVSGAKTLAVSSISECVLQAAATVGLLAGMRKIQAVMAARTLATAARNAEIAMVDLSGSLHSGDAASLSDSVSSGLGSYLSAQGF